jgi:hypothetical protein
MRRTRHDNYATDYRSPRYIVIWTMQHEVIECEVVAPGADLRTAMLAAMERLQREHWEAESDAAWGSVFIRRGAVRRLLMLTARDPLSTERQGFNPFPT